jgi:hypothetical protein
MQEYVQEAPVIRKEIVQALIGVFEKEYIELMKNCPAALQIELTDHLCTIFLQLIRYGNTGGCCDALEIVAINEAALLKKYGKHLAPYWNMNFPGYFKLDTLLLDRKVFGAEAYNALTADGKAMQSNEAACFAKICLKRLEITHTKLLLKAEPADMNGLSEVETVAGTAAAPLADKAFTKARQLLAIHFLLSVGFGVTPRSGADVSSIARLCHLLTGTPYTSLQNSEIYKKYLRLPNIKKGLPYLTDLQYIRGYFIELNLPKLVEAIDQEIKGEQKEKLEERNIKT